MTQPVPTNDAATHADTPNGEALATATANAAAMWSALAHARGGEVTSRPDYLAVRASERFGLRVLMLSADPSRDHLADLDEMIRRFEGPLVIEDPFATRDHSGLGLAPRQMPVMMRHPRPAPPAPDAQVTCVTHEEQLANAERVIATGFPLERFLPYRPGEAFPFVLLERPGFDFFTIDHEGRPAGGCVAVADGHVGGVYWVTTMPEHRSRGIARMLMHAVLRHFDGVPVTLTASRVGKPLYDSLGFQTVAYSTWWS